MIDSELETFRTRRRRCQWTFALGICALVTHFFVMGAEFDFAFNSAKEIVFRGIAIIGLALLGIGITYRALVGRCPACKEPFSSHPKYSDGGVGVFNSIPSCPSCGLVIDGLPTF